MFKRHYLSNHINVTYISNADKTFLSMNKDEKDDSKTESVPVKTVSPTVKCPEIKNSLEGVADVNGNTKVDLGIEKDEVDKLASQSNDAETYVFKCHVCNLLFQNMTTLKLHLKLQHKIGPVTTIAAVVSPSDNFKDTGGDIGETKKNENKIISKTGAIVPYIGKLATSTYCDLCDMYMETRADLLIHQQTIHLGCKPYACKYCAKRFPTVTNQRRHERIHLGQRVKCRLCPSTFTQTGDLKKHVRKLHPEAFNECAFCGKYFSEKSLLDTHLVFHDQNSSSNILEAVRRQHAFKVDPEQDRQESLRLAGSTGKQQKFACTVCKKWFVNYADMRRHRQLAHQKQVMLATQTKTVQVRNTSPFRGQSTSQTIVTREEKRKEVNNAKNFFQQVSVQIADNLSNYVQGTQNDIKKFSDHVSWIDNLPPNTNQTSNDTPPLQVYNFPSNFNLNSNTNVLCAISNGQVSLKPTTIQSQTVGQKAVNVQLSTTQLVSNVPKGITTTGKPIFSSALFQARLPPVITVVDSTNKTGNKAVQLGSTLIESTAFIQSTGKIILFTN